MANILKLSMMLFTLGIIIGMANAILPADTGENIEFGSAITSRTNDPDVVWRKWSENTTKNPTINQQDTIGQDTVGNVPNMGKIIWKFIEDVFTPWSALSDREYDLESTDNIDRVEALFAWGITIIRSIVSIMLIFSIYSYFINRTSDT